MNYSVLIRFYRYSCILYLVLTDRFRNHITIGIYIDGLDFGKISCKNRRREKEKENLNGFSLYFHLLKIFPSWHNTLLQKLQHSGFISFIRYSLFWIGQLRVGT